MILRSSCISSSIFYRIPSPKSASYCEVLYTVGYGISVPSKPLKNFRTESFQFSPKANTEILRVSDPY